MVASSSHVVACTHMLAEIWVDGPYCDSLDRACLEALLHGCCNDPTSSGECQVWFLSSLSSLLDLQ